MNPNTKKIIRDIQLYRLGIIQTPDVFSIIEYLISPNVDIVKCKGGTIKIYDENGTGIMLYTPKDNYMKQYGRVLIFEQLFSKIFKIIPDIEAIDELLIHVIYDRYSGVFNDQYILSYY